MGRFVDDYLKYSIEGILPEEGKGHYRYRFWGFPKRWIEDHYPRSQEDLETRIQCAKKLNALCLSTTSEARLRHSGESTIIYLQTKEDYIKSRSIVGHYAIECNEPIIENLTQRIDELGSIEEFRTCLYYNKYIYKIHMYAGWNSSIEEICALRDQLSDIDDIFVNVAFDRLPKTEKRHLYRGWWKGAKYAVACNDEATASYISFIAGDRVEKITKAVLL